MKSILYTLTIMAFVSCQSGISQDTKTMMTEQNNLTNAKMKEYGILECMYHDDYFPKFLVDKCKDVLVQLCYNIESTQPSNLDELYKLTHASTNKINDLEDEFAENNSEIETAARECLALNFEFIANAYGFDADIEELIATREW